MTEEKLLFEQSHPVKPGRPDFKTIIVDEYLRPVSEEDARKYWAQKSDIQGE